MKLNSKKKKISISKILVIFLIFYFLIKFFWDPMSGIIFELRQNVNLFFLEKEKLLDENISIRKELEREKIKSVFGRYYYDRVQLLENSLSYEKDNKIERKRFSILFSPESSFYSNIILLQKKSNILINQKVYLFDNFLFGKVVAVDDNLIKIRDFSDYNYKNNYIITFHDDIVYRGEGVGDSNGLIKVELPRDLKLDDDSILLIDDGSNDIVGKFLRDDFESQNTQRDVFFKMIKKPEQVMEVEI